MHLILTIKLTGALLFTLNADSRASFCIFAQACLKGEGLMKDLLKKIVEWNEANEYQKCVDSIEAIPEEERGYELTVLLGRAYSNLGVLGDNNSKANEDGVDIFLLEKAVIFLKCAPARAG